MKSFATHESSWAYRSVALMAVLMLAVGMWGRVYQLGFPPERIWDEIYFPVMAREFLQGHYVFDLHPPLGKFIIAASIAVLGDTPLGWRLMPADRKSTRLNSSHA